jgi:GTPase
MAELRRLLPDAVFVSAHSGKGIEALREVIADRLPRPDVFVDALVPYTRGELVSRVHAEGEVVDEEHTPDGTRVRAKVRPDLANALQPFAGAG